MFRIRTRDPIREDAIDPQTKKRREFDALMASMRARRRERCAERVVPMPLSEEVA